MLRYNIYKDIFKFYRTLSSFKKGLVDTILISRHSGALFAYFHRLDFALDIIYLRFFSAILFDFLSHMTINISFGTNHSIYSLDLDEEVDLTREQFIFIKNLVLYLYPLIFSAG
jgi:hypothetical protein